ncbi:MAG: hypothetical protein JRH20_00010 [Deltaproteobacteria bacterium]|nr:hypothetical protein [Deltaproteobacteria bacterium]
MVVNGGSAASTGRITGSNGQYNGVRVFSATMAKERDALGDRISDWLRKHAEADVLDTIVTQSSDDAFHCLTITLFYKE